MKVFKYVVRFLGSIQLAIVLIFCAACSVIIGTIIESYTSSHLAAVHWVYGSIYFQLLLATFFVNILVSALLRWPFHKRHVPFLMTHLGLLMIIGGTIVKNIWGLQGNLILWEGSGAHTVLIPHSYALLVETQKTTEDGIESEIIPLSSLHDNMQLSTLFPDFQCKTIGYAPHMREEFETWIKGSKAYISGLPALIVNAWRVGEVLPNGTMSTLHDGNRIAWKILAMRTAQIAQLQEELYLQDLVLKIIPKNDTNSGIVCPLKQVINEPVVVNEGWLKASLQYDNISEKNTITRIRFAWHAHQNAIVEYYYVALQGQEALHVQPENTTWFESTFEINILRPNPVLCLAEVEESKDVILIALDCHGRCHTEQFKHKHLKDFIVYNKGFNGYAISASIPFPNFMSDRINKQKAENLALTTQLRTIIAQESPLINPLHLFENACHVMQEDCADMLMQFLMHYNGHAYFVDNVGSFSNNVCRVINALKWENICIEDRQALAWLTHFHTQFELALESREHPLDLLKRCHWPFIEELAARQTIDTSDMTLFTLFAKQMLSCSIHLPTMEFIFPNSLSDKVRYFANYLKLYGLDYHALRSWNTGDKENFDMLETYWKTDRVNQISSYQHTFTIEAPLTTCLITDLLPKKIEDHRPGILLEIGEGIARQTIALAYDPSATMLKWPVMGGKYVLRLQPMLYELPYHLRLRQARQISYPNSSQIYSYECDILITEKGQKTLETTLSMNHIYETWDGYRFYLAGIGMSPDQTLKKVQLVVNHDPAKYYLTYPGAILVFIGICLLFWRNHHRKIY